jgi:hypothetical protein
MAMEYARDSGGCADRLIHAIGFAILWIGMGMTAICALPLASVAQNRRVQEPAIALPLVACPTVVALNGRLVFEQWAETVACSRPVRTRATDRYLGFSCHEIIGQGSACRSFVPPPDSRALDTSRRPHCVDVAFTLSDVEMIITRIRMWEAETGQCVVSQAPEALAMEVDLTEGQVCAGGFCTPANRLSPIGRLRLRHLMVAVFKDLETSPTAESPSLSRAANWWRKRWWRAGSTRKGVGLNR